MDGSCITDTTSEAYAQISNMYVVDGLYVQDGYVGVAMSSFYGGIGDKFMITLSSGIVFYAIMTDTKQNAHIDENYAHKVDGSVIEFVVDEDTLPSEVKLAGSLDVIYSGSIVKIERLDK